MHNISAFVNLYVYIRQLLCSVYKSQRWSENTLSKLPLCKLLILNNSCYKQVHAFSTVPKQTKFTSNKQIISYTTYDPDQKFIQHIFNRRNEFKLLQKKTFL